MYYQSTINSTLNFFKVQMTLGIHWVTMTIIFKPEEHLNYCGKIMPLLYTE